MRALGIFFAFAACNYACALLFTRNTTGSYCTGRERIAFLSDHVVGLQKVAAGGKMVKFHGWDSSTVIAAPQKLPSLLTTKNVNEMGKRLMRHTLDLPFDGPLVEILLEHEHGKEYGLRIGVGQESLVIKCERHCRFQVLLLRRDGVNIEIDFQSKTLFLKSDASTFTLGSAENVYVTLIDAPVSFTTTKTVCPDLVFELATFSDHICLNYFYTEGAQIGASLQLPGQLFPLPKSLGTFEWLELKVEVKPGSNLSARIMLNPMDEIFEYKPEFFLLSSLACSDDVVFTIGHVLGCSDATEKIDASSAPFCEDYDCDCGEQCLLCSEKGCACSVREDLEFCHRKPALPPPPYVPPKTTKAPTPTPTSSPTKPTPTKLTTKMTPTMAPPLAPTEVPIFAISSLLSTGLGVAGLAVVIVGIWLYWKIKTRAAPPSTRPISMTAEFGNAAYSTKVEEVTVQYHTPIYEEVATDVPVEEYLVPCDLPYNPYEHIDAIYSRIRDSTDSESSSFSWGSSGSTRSR